MELSSVFIFFLPIYKVGNRRSKEWKKLSQTTQLTHGKVGTHFRVVSLLVHHTVQTWSQFWAIIENSFWNLLSQLKVWKYFTLFLTARSYESFVLMKKKVTPVDKQEVCFWSDEVDFKNENTCWGIVLAIITKTLSNPVWMLPHTRLTVPYSNTQRQTWAFSLGKLPSPLTSP